MILWLRKFFHRVASHRSWWQALIAINFIGSLYGFWWYRYQLLDSPRWQWPIIPDSPGATLLLTIWLGLLLGGVEWRRPGMQWLGAVAFAANMKYGLWTAIVLPTAGMELGWKFDYVYLSLSHAGMWLQGMVFARYYKPALAPAVGALLYMWFQDLIDYKVLLTYPTLPHLSLFSFAKLAAVSLSTLWGGFLIVQALFDRMQDKS